MWDQGAVAKRYEPQVAERRKPSLPPEWVMWVMQLSKGRDR
jgi:hypothetical protein